MSAKLPKLSYVLLSHNREKYIRTALESAFAQDYEGELEYIISDDCSTDRTFQIIQEYVAAYKGGRRVVATQTPHNMHLAGNTNHAVQFVTGEWVVRADDDDISRIDRCSQIGRAIALHPGCSYVLTKQERFDDKAEEQALRICQTAGAPHPAMTLHDIRRGDDGLAPFFSKNSSNKAWSAHVYRQFGPLPLAGCYVDDVMCLYRANALGFGVAIQEITMMARDGSGNMSRGNDTGNRGYADIIRLEKFNDQYFNVSQEPLQQTLDDIAKYLKEHASGEEWRQVGIYLQQIQSTLDKRRLQCSYWRKGTLNRFLINWKIGNRNAFSLIRSLPMPAYAAILSTMRKMKNSCASMKRK